MDADRQAALLFAVLEAPAVVASLDDVAVVGQPVEKCRRHLAVAEHGGPIGEGQIGGAYVLRFSNRARGITLSGVKGGWR